MPKVIIIEKKAVETKCKKCGYTWLYTGTTLYACSCPKCGTSVVIYPRKNNKKTSQVDSQQKTSSNVTLGEGDPI